MFRHRRYHLLNKASEYYSGVKLLGSSGRNTTTRNITSSLVGEQNAITISSRRTKRHNYLEVSLHGAVVLERTNIQSLSSSGGEEAVITQQDYNGQS